MSTPTREPTPAADWDRRYQTGDLPWDTGVADHNLLETLEMLKLPAGGALEIGCGTGTNAIVLAQHGLRPVVATDVSSRAIELAQAKAKQAGVEVDFRVHDIVQSLPVEPGSVQFVFDRGCFHSMGDQQRPVFVQRVLEALAPRGWWLSLCGNADDPSPGGPPRMTATQIATLVEPGFEIETITRGRFRDVSNESVTVYLNWRVLLRKREPR